MIDLDRPAMPSTDIIRFWVRVSAVVCLVGLAIGYFGSLNTINPPSTTLIRYEQQEIDSIKQDITKIREQVQALEHHTANLQQEVVTLKQGR